MKIICISLIFLFLSKNEIHSQNDSLGTIKGYVMNSTDEKTLSNATVTIDKYRIGSKTDRDGYFELNNLPPGNQFLTISYLGFKTIKKLIRIQKGKSKIISIGLDPILLFTEDIVINSNSDSIIKKNFKKHISNIELTPEQINSIPGLGEFDLLRSLQALPGIQSMSDYSSMPYIRGGTPNQNLYLIDGTVIYNPEHAFGMFSTFNTSSIKNVDLSKGGFGAEYGGRLSSVLNVTSLGSNRESLLWDLSLSLMSGSIATILPLGSLGYISGSFRRTYLEGITAKFINAIPPYYFLDGSFKMVLNIGDKNKITVNYFGSMDNLDYVLNKDSKENVGFNYNWQNRITSFHWDWIITENILAGLSLSESNYNSQFTFEEMGMNTLNRIGDYTLKSNLEYFYSKYFTFRFGYEYKLINSLFYEDLIDKKINIFRPVNFQSGYIITGWNPSASFNIEAGLRFDYLIAQKKYNNLDPRFSIKYCLTESSNLKISTGIYHQYINSLPRLFIANIFTTADKSAPGSYAYHYIGAYQVEIGKSITLDIESYLKVYKNIYQYNQNFLADVKTSYFLNDNRPLIVESERLYNRGDGKSYGIELLLRKEYGFISGWIGYTIAKSEFKFNDVNNGKSFVPGFDRSSTINLNINIDLIYLFNENKSGESSKLLVGINFLYAAGLPFTVPSSSYFVQKLPDWKSSQYSVSYYTSQLNNMRLPPYIRLDFSLSYEKLFDDWSVMPYIQVFNLFNRENIWFINYDAEIINKKITLQTKKINMLPLLPSIGINVKFRKMN